MAVGWLGSLREGHQEEVTFEKGFGGCVGVFQANMEAVAFEDRRENVSKHMEAGNAGPVVVEASGVLFGLAVWQPLVD